MPTFPVAIKNERADTLLSKINDGTLNTYGQLWLKDSSSNVLSKHDCSATAFQTAASGQAESNTIGDGTGLLAGNASSFTFVDKDESEVWSGTVTAVGGGGDLESDKAVTSISVGETVSIGTVTYVEGG